LRISLSGSLGGTKSKRTVRQGGAFSPAWTWLSPQLPVRMRSERMRPRSTSTMAMVASVEKRSVSARSSPISKIEAWPSQARSVVDSPGPAAE
jgi:hypothetical protein